MKRLVLCAMVLAVLGACGSSGGTSGGDTAGVDATPEAAADVTADPEAIDKDGTSTDVPPDAVDDAADDAAVPDPGAETAPGVVEPAPDAAEPPAEVVDETVDETVSLPCPGPGDAFDPDHPGVNVTFAITAFGMMGTDQDMAIDMFLPSAREDFVVEKPDVLPLDTCVLGSGVPVVPGCATDADCAPEQKCLAPQDEPSNLQCVTPRDPLNVGPFTATGFKSGPRTFTYNAQQSGGYTSTPDGSVPASELVFDQVYVAEGPGDPAQGLGPFKAQLYVPAQLQLLEPQADSSGMFPAIPADTTADLTLTWTTGTDGGTLDIALSTVSGTAGKAITCHAANDGSFTIPADLLAQVGLNASNPMFNMLTLTRETPGHVCGEGVTYGTVKFATVVMLNVKKVN